MTLQELIDVAVSRLGNRDDEDTLKAVNLELKFTQKQVLERKAHLPWFLVSPDLVTTNETGKIAVPEGFLREYEDGAMFWVKDNKGTQLRKVEFERLPTEPHVGRPPKVYALIGNCFQVDAVEKGGSKFLLRIYRSEPWPEEPEGTNNWIKEAGNLLLATTLLRLGPAFDLETRILQQYENERQQAERDLINATAAREVANQEYVMGGD